MIPAYAQEKDTTNTDSTKKLTQKEGWESVDNNSGAGEVNKWDDIGSHIFDFKIKGAPTISFSYGTYQMT